MRDNPLNTCTIQWFSTGEDFDFQEISKDILVFMSRRGPKDRWYWHIVGRHQRQINIPQCTGQPPTTKSNPIWNVNKAKVEKHWCYYALPLNHFLYYICLCFQALWPTLVRFPLDVFKQKLQNVCSESLWGKALYSFHYASLPLALCLAASEGAIHWDTYCLLTHMVYEGWGSL